MLNFKHAKDRNGIVQVQGTLDGVFERISTGLASTKNNMTMVDGDWREWIRRLRAEGKGKLQTVEAKANILLKDYGMTSLTANAYTRKPNVQKEYESIFEIYIVKLAFPFSNELKPLGEYDIRDIKPTHIRAWQSHLLAIGKKGGRIRTIRMVLSKFFTDAIGDGHITSSPLKNVVPAKVEKPDIVPLTRTEVGVLLDNADGWYKNFLNLAIFSGMRTGEMMALKWDKISFETKKIKIDAATRHGVIGTVKTESSERTIDMLPPVEEALRLQYRLTGMKGGYVFLNSQNKPFLQAQSISKTHWFPLLKRCSIIKRTQYQTRHTFATMMISAGENILWVSKMMGHADPTITLKKYAKYLDEPDVVNGSRALESFDLHTNYTQNGVLHKKAGA